MLRIPKKWRDRWMDPSCPPTPEDGAEAGTFNVSGGVRRLRVVATTGGGWEHASVSVPGRLQCPTWDEMAWVKRELWEPEDVVLQVHPAESEYVNFQPYTLHLWRHPLIAPTLPPRWMVGPYEGWKLEALEHEERLKATEL